MKTAPPIEQEVIELLHAWRGGDRAAKHKLFERLYLELRGMAGKRIASERPDHTLVPTSLVHEVFLRLESDALSCADRAEFLRLAASVMRHILIDSARRRRHRRRMSGADRERLESASLSDREGEVLARLEPALAKLGHRDPDLLRVCELRFLLGFDVAETARVLGVSTATVKRDWRTARAFLHRELTREES